MLDPPSQELIQRLTRLKLCTPADLRRCRSRVRKLARGIPAFDSVWLDALVQAQKITPFQARTLESGSPERLAVGPYLLISELGQSHKSSTYIAKVPESTEQCVLKITRPQTENLNQIQQNFQSLLKRLQGLQHSSLILPRTIKQLQQQFVVISPYRNSRTVSELLIRRGRFPVHVVLAIGAQLLDALAALETRNVVHGDIRPWNVRIAQDGTATLVDVGLKPILCPELTIHASLPPRSYDGIAPELIGTGHHPDSKSDLYALGCLLWELLAGRPPFTTGDPLAKLACHQTKTVPDIRSWAPETPASLADALACFVAPDPEQRPATFREAQKLWPAQSNTARKPLSKFHASFQNQSPRRISESTAGKTGQLSLIALLIFVLSGLSLTLMDEGARNQILKITSQVTFSPQATPPEQNTTAKTDTAEPEHVARNLLPPPDENGLIVLDSNEPYESTKITTVGPLTIKGLAQSPAVIRVDNEALQIVSAQFTLENVILVSTQQANEPESAEREPGALLNVTAQSLKLKSCLFAQIDQQKPAPASAERSAICWKPLDSQQRTGSHLEIQDTVFAVPQHAVRLSHAPQDLTLSNCLNITSRSTLYFEKPPEVDQQVSIQLKQLTLRKTGPLLVLAWPDSPVIPGSIQIENQDCVFDLEAAALIQVLGTQPPENWLSTVGLIGEGSVASSDIIVAGWRATPEQPLEELNSMNMLIEGLSTGKFEYAAPLSLNPANSTITKAQVPRKSALPPGIQVGTLPDFLTRLLSLEN